MKDPVFTGKDVAEAVRLASRTLAVAESSLRYVVLDAGQPGGRGLSATEARIAVLIERVVAGGRADEPGYDTDLAEIEAGSEEAHGRRRRRGEAPMRPGAEQPPDDPAAGVRTALEELGRAAGVDLLVDVGDGRERVEVTIEGAGAQLFFDPRGETLAALEHVIDRLYGRALAGRRVRVRCAGYREYRDEVLRSEALELASEVRRDGQARTTAPLNAYERRVIHMALEGHEGLTTFSVGEGQGRRVTIAVVEHAEAEGRPRADSSGVSVDPCAQKPDPAEQPAVAPEVRPAAFDPKAFDRPPADGGASELM